jgi:hypothetical protein
VLGNTQPADTVFRPPQRRKQDSKDDGENAYAPHVVAPYFAPNENVSPSPRCPHRRDGPWTRVTGLGGGYLQRWLRIEIVKPEARTDVSVLRLSDPPPGRLSTQQELGSLRQRALESNTSAAELEDRRQSRSVRKLSLDVVRRVVRRLLEDGVTLRCRSWSGTTGSSDIVRILVKPTIRVTTTRPLPERLKEAPHRVATELRELAKDQDAVMGECSRMSLEGAEAQSRHRITHAGIARWERLGP